MKGLIPKYGADGQLSATGRTYKYDLIDKETGEVLEELIAKKKDDVAVELKKCPGIQTALIEIIKNSIEDPDSLTTYNTEDTDSDMTDEDFERQAIEDAEKIKNGKMSEAEEESGSWEDI